MGDRERTIVVGVDASEESDGAVDWACGVAGPDDRIVLIHAWEIPVSVGYESMLVTDPNEIEVLAKQGLDEIVERFGDPRLEPVVRRGHAGRAIVQESEGADAIVVGHRGSSRLSLMLGSTANYVLHHTTRPVVVIRGDHQNPPRWVVVGVDDADELDDSPSVRALRFAYDLPGVERVSVLHAWFLPPLAIGVFNHVTSDMEAMDEAAQRVIDSVVAAAGDPPDGVRLDTEPARGTGGFALIEASRTADLVVVGSRGRGGFSGLLLGSTTAEVAAHSHSPVAVVR